MPIVIPTPRFSCQELEIINKSINHLSNNNASTITRYASHDPPITVADIGDDIDFRYVFSRDSEYSYMNK